MGTPHDAHDILAAYGAIYKLRSIDEKLEVLTASLSLHDDEIHRVTLSKKSMNAPRGSMKKSCSERKRSPAFPKLLNVHAQEVAVFTHSMGSGSRCTPIYNALPFRGSKKVKGSQSANQLNERDRQSVNQFRKYFSTAPDVY